MLFTVLLAMQILLALLLIGVILLQQGKGATAGAAFGSGASSTVFGARGSASFLTRVTSVLATLFFANCLLLVYLQGGTVTSQSLLDQALTQPPATSAPAPATSELDIDKLATEALQGKPADVPAPPPADVPAADAPATSAPAAASGDAPAAAAKQE